MDKLDFVAIDLETATRERFSICEIGIAIVQNGQVTDSRSWLVQPPYNRYEGINVYIHGIRPCDTEDCRTFPEVWLEVEPFLNNQVVVAHNAAFDICALRDTFKVFHMDFPSFQYYCSYRLAKKTVPHASSYTLPLICQDLGINFGKHHRAEGDAIGCAEVFCKCIELSQVSSFVELQTKYNFRCGAFTSQEFRSIHSFGPLKRLSTDKKHY